MKIYHVIPGRWVCFWIILAVCAITPRSWSFDTGINDLHGGTPVGNGDNQPEGDDESDDDANDPSNSDDDGGDGNQGNDDDGQEAEPVSLFSGQFHLEVLDIDIAGPLPLQLKRCYRSASPYQGMFGRGWNMKFNERIFLLQNGDLLLRSDNAARGVYTVQGNNTYAPPKGFYHQLWRNADGSYTLRERHGALRLYNIEGCLVEVRDREGHQIFCSYEAGGKQPINAISDYSHFTNAIMVARDYRLRRMETGFNNVRSGRFIEFTYDASGRVIQSLDFTGRVWKYQYDPDGHGFLMAATTPPVPGFPDGLTTRYNYYATNNHGLATLTDPAGSTYLTNFYDAQHRIVKQNWGGVIYLFGYPNDTTRVVTNGNGFRVERTFDDAGHVLTRKEYTAGLRPGTPAFYLTTYQYDANHRQTKAIKPAGNVYANKYDSLGNMSEARIKSKDVADGTNDLVHAFTFESRFNFKKTATDPLGNVTTYVYDYENPAYGSTNGRLMRVILPAVNGTNPVINYTYNPFGQVETMTDANGKVVRTSYDTATGKPAQRIQAFGTPQATTNHLSYDARGNLISRTDAAGHTTTYAYDNLDRRIQETAPAPFNYVTKYSRNARGQVEKVERQTGDLSAPWQVRAYAYDALGHVTLVTDPLGRVTIHQYDGVGNRTNTVAAGGTTTATIYDERNLPWKFIVNQTNITQHAYDTNGHLAVIQDSRTNTTRFIRNAYDQLVTNRFSDGSIESYQNSTSGKVVIRQDRSGQSTTNFYDALDRLVLRRYADGTSNAFNYTLGGLLLQAAGPEGVTSLGYDDHDRVSAVTNADGTHLAYEYNSVGNCSKLTYPDGTFVTYAYDALKRLTNVAQQGGQTVASYQYDALNRRTRTQFGNGTAAEYGYDADHQVTGLTHRLSASGAVLGRFLYTYNEAGDRLSMTTEQVPSAGLHQYQYDKQRQLTSVAYPAGGYPFPNATYRYDSTGNRIQMVADSTINYTVNTLNQYTAINGVSCGFDLKGNMTGDGTATYAYDARNRLTQVNRPGTAATYQYDLFGRRIAKTVNSQTTRYVYAGIRLIAEYDGGGQLLRKHVVTSDSNRPVKTITAAGDIYYHYDALGSVAFQTDAAGAKTESFAYDAFGRPDHAPAGSRFLFAGQLYDPESGLYFMLARYYSPSLGRFIQEDAARDWQQPNAYLYVRNNPVNFTDPFGLAPGDKYPTQDDAGRAAANDVYQDSVDNNREYGGYIVQNDDGTYSYTAPVQGTEAGLDLGDKPANATADYHSHGADSHGVYDDEHFSDTDTNGNDASDTDGYLVTPHGDIKRYDHDSGDTAGNDLGNVNDPGDGDDGGEDGGEK